MKELLHVKPCCDRLKRTQKFETCFPSRSCASGTGVTRCDVLKRCKGFKCKQGSLIRDYQFNSRGFEGSDSCSYHIYCLYVRSKMDICVIYSIRLYSYYILSIVALSHLYSCFAFKHVTSVCKYVISIYFALSHYILSSCANMSCLPRHHFVQVSFVTSWSFRQRAGVTWPWARRRWCHW